MYLIEAIYDDGDGYPSIQPLFLVEGENRAKEIILNFNTILKQLHNLVEYENIVSDNNRAKTETFEAIRQEILLSAWLYRV